MTKVSQQRLWAKIWLRLLVYIFDRAREHELVWSREVIWWLQNASWEASLLPAGSSPGRPTAVEDGDLYVMGFRMMEAKRRTALRTAMDHSEAARTASAVAAGLAVAAAALADGAPAPVPAPAFASAPANSAATADTAATTTAAATTTIAAAFPAPDPRAPAPAPAANASADESSGDFASAVAGASALLGEPDPAAALSHKRPRRVPKQLPQSKALPDLRPLTALNQVQRNACWLALEQAKRQLPTSNGPTLATRAAELFNLTVCANFGSAAAFRSVELGTQVIASGAEFTRLMNPPHGRPASAPLRDALLQPQSLQDAPSFDLPLSLQNPPLPPPRLSATAAAAPAAARPNQPPRKRRRKKRPAHVPSLPLRLTLAAAGQLSGAAIRAAAAIMIGRRRLEHPALLKDRLLAHLRDQPEQAVTLTKEQIEGARAKVAL